MPTPALLLLIATLLPLASFLLLTFVGKRMGEPLAGYVGTFLSGGSMVLSLAALAMWLNASPGADYGAGIGPIVQTFAWLPAGLSATTSGSLEVGIYIDSLTIALFSTITLVATLVHFFSVGYMADDERFARFFTYLGLFCFCMLALIIAGTLVQMFVFWELVGLCSYLLIGFWYERKSASNAAIKAFIMNRIGDAGFLIGFGILFYHLGNATLPQIWVSLGRAGMLTSGEGLVLAGGTTFSYASLTAMGLCLFLGAVGKSAQVPLHTWLADAMEGPSPVSALIHSATMVAAGVYFVARLFPVLTIDVKFVIAIVGVTTLTIGALVAVVQTDIKRVLAYSTMSQLGYMMLAIGVGSWVGALFHLVTHAFFKSMLFLSAGSVIHATHHEQDMRRLGGLYKRLPITALTFGVGVLAIAGTPLLGGYYSKSMILTHAAAFGLTAEAAGRSSGYWLLFILPAVMAYVTAFYMARCWMLTFAGRPRDQKIHEEAEESWVMYTPLLALMVMTVMPSRYIGVEDLVTRSVKEAQRHCESIAGGQPYRGFTTMWPVTPPTEAKSLTAGDVNSMPDIEPPAVTATVGVIEQATRIEHRWAFWAFAIGILLAAAMYLRGFAIADGLMRIAPLRWFHTVLLRAFFIDELYNALFARTTRAASTIIGLFDQYVVDGVVNAVAFVTKQLATLAGITDRYVVDGVVTTTAAFAQDIGAAVRTPQTGRIRVYVTALVLVSVLAVAVTVFVMMF